MRQASKYIEGAEGSTTVEFALVGAMFILAIMLIMSTALVLYVNQALNNATAHAARQILTGSFQSQSTTPTPEGFKQILCENLLAPIKCDDVIVNLYVVTKASKPSGYYAYVKPDLSGLALADLSVGSGPFNIGKRGDYQYLQVIYPVAFLPRIISSWLSGGVTYNGKPAYLAISAAAFRVEQY